MTDNIVWWDPPVKQGSTWVLRLYFKKAEDAIEHMVENSLIGDNSYEHAVDMWRQRTSYLVNKEATGFRARLKKWFKKQR